jgi:predicted metal-dependent peptidase
MSKSLVFTGKGSSLSLAQKMRQGLATIREEKALAKAAEGIILLLDVSGSMSEHVGEKRKIDHLREAVQDYVSLRKVSFSYGVTEGSIPNPSGSTNLAGAFEYLLASRPKEIILISDGLPDSQESALAAAKSLACPVNVIYIGPGGDEGEAFMKRLAAETGGKQATADTRLYRQNFGRQLTNSVRLMLPS